MFLQAIFLGYSFKNWSICIHLKQLGLLVGLFYCSEFSRTVRDRVHRYFKEHNIVSPGKIKDFLTQVFFRTRRCVMGCFWGAWSSYWWPIPSGPWRSVCKKSTGEEFLKNLSTDLLLPDVGVAECVLCLWLGCLQLSTDHVRITWHQVTYHPKLHEICEVWLLESRTTAVYTTNNYEPKNPRVQCNKPLSFFDNLFLFLKVRSS